MSGTIRSQIRVEFYRHLLRSTVQHSALPASPTWPLTVPTVKSLSARNDLKANQSGIVRTCTTQYHLGHCITGVPHPAAHRTNCEEFVRTQRSEVKSDWNCTYMYYAVLFGAVHYRRPHLAAHRTNC